MLARIRSSEAGFTLAELMVAMMVLALASGVFLTTLASVQKSVAETDIRTRSNTQARLALDAFEGGRIAGEHLAKITGGKARVAVLEGIPGHETGDSRLRGFREALGKHPGMNIVASQPANWERDQGFTVFQNMLQAHPDLDAVFACSDLMALGAIEAIDRSIETRSSVSRGSSPRRAAV